ncbi:MAG: 23S rRNA (guanosine(2251)-2'-O)-methyltransferase RlmB, partial [Alicyclobacillaceae bacterium]|nr:23S rRNA (guanosine(2251)-2'-O)-methyltransferase RlmB [Alicyclobacillaceae bacterium]
MNHRRKRTSNPTRERSSSAPRRRSSTAPAGSAAQALHWEQDLRDTVGTGVEEPDWVAGRRAVLEALQAGRRVNKVVVAEHAEGGSLSEIIAKASSLGIVVQKVPRSTLSRLAGDHHQGVLAYVSPYEYVDLEDVIGRDTGQLPLVVLLDGVTDPHNVGAIVRTAEAAGAQGVVLPKRRSAPLTSTVAKAAAGALEYIPVARVTNLVQAMEQLKRRGYWLVGADVAGSVPYTRFDYRVPVAVVI